jgi:predicted MPP superfamily phosphohydrolase
MRSFNDRIAMDEAYKRLVDKAESEAVAFLQQNLSQIDNWTTDYVALEIDFLRMKKSAGKTRVIVIGRQLEEPDNMAIFGDENYHHHPNTDNARINERRRKQETSLRKRINEHSSSKINQFSFIND